MNALIETLNLFGQRFTEFALPMLIQSSLLIAFLLVLDLVLRQQVRASIRYGLWMLVLIKLILPPSFASPTGVGYWLTLKQPDKQVVAPAPVQVSVSYSPAEPIHIPSTTPIPLPRYRPTLTWPAIMLLGWASVAIALLFWLVLRARFVARISARASDAPESLLQLLQSCRQQLRIKQSIRLKLSSEAGSPAVCGLWRPTILIPSQLANKLSTLSIRAVLLHELSHIKRGDLWLNYAQTSLQIVYWYNPLLWLANAVIRRVREQAVDEMVMVEMGQEADAYPTTLLEVAKLTFTRSVLSLGLVGIMESKGTLKQRIQALLSRPIPKVARLGWKGLTCVGLTGLVALPMASHPKANAIEANKPSQPTARIEAATTNLPLGVFKFDTNKFLAELREQTRLPDPSSLAEEQEALRKLFANAGAELKPPARMVYRGHGAISVNATVKEMEVVKQVLLKLDPGVQLALFPESHSHTNAFGASTGHQTIVNKLDSIRLDSVLYDGMPLNEVVKDLNLKAKKHDPDGLGITFFIDTAASATGGIWYIPITIKPALKSVRLADVLDAILKVAPQTISYEVGNSTVAFLPGTPAQRLYFRSFWVNTNTFIPALQRLAGQPPSKSMTALLKDFRDFLEALGASLLPPKEISYVEDRQGFLMVRGTSNDLAIVEKAIQEFGALGVAPTNVDQDSARIPRFIPAVVLPTNTAIGIELLRNDLGTPSVGDTKAPAAGQPIRPANATPMPTKDKVPVLGDLPLPDLARLLKGTGSQNERIKAADAIGAIAYRNPNAPEVQAAVPTLMSVAQKGDIEVRFRAVQALGAIGQGASNAAPVLIQLTQDTNSSVRMCAVEALGRIGADSPESLAALKVAMNDTSDDVRVTAKHALEILYQTPAIRTNKVYAGRLVQDGRVRYELGKLDEAEAKLNQALTVDPGNVGANYYLNLIREKRYSLIAQARERAPKESPSFPNPYARTNMMIYTSKGRQAILSKLDRIRFDTVLFDGLPLSEVVKTLGIEAKKHDPEKKGINFVINGPPTGSPIDPITGQFVEAERIDINSVAITISPAITDVRLADVLDAIVKVADKPIKYSIEDYGVVLSAKTAEAAPLYTRFFKFDPNMLVQTLQRWSGESANTNVYSAIRGYLMDAGVNLDPPKNLFYKDRQGMLMVRGTLQDLDIVESIVQNLNVPPPQIQISARFVEVSQNDSRALGFDWFLGNFPLTNDKVLPGNTSSSSSIIPAPSERLRTNRLRDSGTNSAPLLGILTDPQSRVVQRTLEQRSGVDSAETTITTLSGRLGTLEIPNSSSLRTNQFMGTNALDFVAYVSADGHTISLTLLPGVRSQQPIGPVNVRDGQTVVVGNVVEFPGDEKRLLLLFLTPTIVDPAGNRVHTDDEIPAAKRK